VPIRLVVTGQTSEEAIFAAACLPNSLFMRTVRPYRLRQPAVDAYELVIGPEGFGAVLLEALQWLARVTAAGISGALPQEHMLAFVKQSLEVEKPEWRFEEITEHAAAFIAARYRLAETDAEYRQALARKQDEPTLSALIEELRRWAARQS
jgi:hypothetical protein